MLIEKVTKPLRRIRDKYKLLPIWLREVINLAMLGAIGYVCFVLIFCM